MARTLTQSKGGSLLPDSALAFLKNRMMEGIGLGLMLIAAAGLAALASYAPGDPSLNAATDARAQNWLGKPGAVFADLTLQILGLAALLPAIVLAAWGALVFKKRTISKILLRLLTLIGAAAMGTGLLAALPAPAAWPFVTGLGGVIGDLLMGKSFLLVQPHWADVRAWMLGLVFALAAIPALLWALALTREDWHRMGLTIRSGLGLARDGAGWIKGKAPDVTQVKIPGLPDFILDRVNPVGTEADDTATEGAAETVREPAARTSQPAPKEGRKLAKPAVETKTAAVKTGKRAEAQRQPKLDLGLEDGDYVFPPLDLLSNKQTKSESVSKEALEQNAELLASVLADFGVKGEIVKVRPGPVVTLYELEPAPGTKTSRVIGLADDIARSMSAVSVRVAVVTGRNVIGIELPNQTREMVLLREMLASEALEKQQGKLPLALGKDIGGAPMIVDLSRMPHLLIAGTTGSGKSVAVNTMILSLLYQLTPEQCRFIMIDPKMLELSVYDGIPHLLSPVVTEPGKAVVALKWAVREMEERYRSMSEMGVRNISGYNHRLAEARKKGEALTRRVQTGFDADGKPVFEDQPLSTDPLPNIVVVVDEMADLMLVAGKDVEAAIQRLAQMARAAGIHLIMATQRPSVDVITGTIKANFPTRISFQVTSKIDSRTILGEQGAEQLLGQGDMLYMAGGGRITRIHGPFCSDEEVEEVVKHLCSQGQPDYIESITEEPEEFDPTSGEGSGDELYDQAVALIAREGKASTSFIQRHLQIGYNRAARIIDQMEAQGVVSPADRVGRREVLVGNH